MLEAEVYRVTDDQYYVGFVASAAINEEMLYVAGAFYSDPNEPITESTRAYVYNPNMEGKWFHHDVDGQVIDLCFLPPLNDKPRIGCALVADSNMVEFYNSNEHYFETIHESKNSTNITINALKFIGGELYALGSDGAIFKRHKDWDLISSTIYKPAQGIEGELTIEQAMEFADRVELIDMCKTDQGSFYAVGQSGFIAYADSEFAWKVIDTPYDEHFGGVIAGSDGNIWIAGFNGLLLYGNHEDGFEDKSNLEDNQNFGPICKYEDYLILGAWEGLFKYEHGKIERIPTLTKLDDGNGTLPIIGVHVVNEVIWVVCDRAIFKFDGQRWMEISHPDTELI